MDMGFRVAGTGGRRIIKLCRAHTALAHTWSYYTIGEHTAVTTTRREPKPKRQLHKTLFTMRGCRLCQLVSPKKPKETIHIGWRRRVRARTQCQRQLMPKYILWLWLLGCT